jgi:hypothetical protein
VTGLLASRTLRRLPVTPSAIAAAASITGAAGGGGTFTGVLGCNAVIRAAAVGGGVAV